MSMTWTSNASTCGCQIYYVPLMLRSSLWCRGQALVLPDYLKLLHSLWALDDLAWGHPRLAISQNAVMNPAVTEYNESPFLVVKGMLECEICFTAVTICLQIRCMSQIVQGEAIPELYLSLIKVAALRWRPAWRFPCTVLLIARCLPDANIAETASNISFWQLTQMPFLILVLSFWLHPVGSRDKFCTSFNNYGFYHLGALDHNMIG